jgi:hypothetical protein
MYIKCELKDIEASWSLAGVKHLSVRKAATLAGVSRGTFHLHRQLYTRLQRRFPKLCLVSLSLQQARAITPKKT